jgi:hypothetical protein
MLVRVVLESLGRPQTRQLVRYILRIWAMQSPVRSVDGVDFAASCTRVMTRMRPFYFL